MIPFLKSKYWTKPTNVCVCTHVYVRDRMWTWRQAEEYTLACWHKLLKKGGGECRGWKENVSTMYEAISFMLSKLINDPL